MANLSNINDKFLFTDGDFLLIGGATANNISATESGVAIKNSNAAILSLQNSATNGKNHTLWSNTDGSFNITDVGVATRFTIASGGDVYIPSGNVSIGNTSVYPSGSNTILQIYSVSVPRLKLQNSTTGTAATAGSSFYVTGDDLIINNAEPGATIQFDIGGEARMRIDGDGNVGIGTISPQTNLHIDEVLASPVLLVKASGQIGSTAPYSKLVLAAGSASGADVGSNIMGYRTADFSSAAARSTGLKFGVLQNNVAKDAMWITEAQKVGIGIDSPASKLHIDSNSDSVYTSGFRSGELRVANDNSSNVANQTSNIVLSASGWAGGTTGVAQLSVIQDGSNVSNGTFTIKVRDNGTHFEAFRIKHNGNVGIGTSSPSSTLTIGNDTDNVAELRVLRSNASSSTYAYVDTVGGTAQFGGTGDVRLKADGASILRFNTNSAERMRIDSSGVVSITNTGAAVLKLQAGTNNSASLRLINDAHDWDVNCQTNDRFAIYSHTDATERLVILPTSGNVGIGITSPNTTLHVDAGQNGGNLTNNVAACIGGGFVTNDLYHREGGLLLISGTNATQTSAGIAFQTRNTGNTNYWKSSILMNRGGELEFYTGGAGTGQGTRRLLIQSDGSLKVPSVHSQTTGIGANVVVLSDGELLRSTSSLKYKTDVRDYDKGLNEVMQLQPKYYKGKNDESETQFAGLIAEDVHDLGLTEFVQYANDGSPDALSYTNMIALLTKGIQELKAEIELLKTQINN